MTPVNCTMGPKPLLDKAASSVGLTLSIEKFLQDYCIDMSRRGFPLMKDNLCALVKKILDEEHLENPFKDGVPGKTWFLAFLRRHPNLSQKRAEHHSLARAAVTEGALRGWFTIVLTYARESGNLGRLRISNRVLNGDETPFRICEISGKSYFIFQHTIFFYKSVN